MYKTLKVIIKISWVIFLSMIIYDLIPRSIEKVYFNYFGINVKTANFNILIVSAVSFVILAGSILIFEKMKEHRGKSR